MIRGLATPRAPIEQVPDFSAQIRTRGKPNFWCVTRVGSAS
jgi:hypothetical protein